MLVKNFMITLLMISFTSTGLQGATSIDAPKDPSIPAQETNRELLGEVSLAETPETKIWQYAGGLGAVWSVRRDYGARSFKRFEPELIGFLYTQLPVPRLWLRHGARMSYSTSQPQMPQSVRIEENDFKISIDEALLINSIITASLSLGAGYDWREIIPKKETPVLASDDRLKTKDSFAWYYAQVGVGIPALQGQYLLEPLMRWQHLPLDRRTTWAFGFELTRAW